MGRPIIWLRVKSGLKIDFRGSKVSTNNAGREFERQFKNSCPKDVFIYKIKDNPNFSNDSMSISSKNPFDFIMYSYPNLFLIEMKSTKGSSFSFSEKIIKKHQRDSLQLANNYYGIYAGFIFNFRPRKLKNGYTENLTFYIGISTLNEFIDLTNKKSINIEDCRMLGIEIESNRKITRYDYNVTKFIEDVKNSKKNIPT